MAQEWSSRAKVLQRCSGRLFPPGRFAVVLGRCSKGQLGLRSTDGEELGDEQSSPELKFRLNSGETRAQSWCRGCRELHGATVELMWGTGWLVLQRSGVAAVAHELCTAERAGGGVGARWRLRCGMIGHGEVRGG